MISRLAVIRRLVEERARYRMALEIITLKGYTREAKIAAQALRGDR